MALSNDQRGQLPNGISHLLIAHNFAYRLRTLETLRPTYLFLIY